ncbi:MAG: ABC transporter, partial [Clostridia bacterium]|nr:ABC transporter [Clostridia bacterium]
LYKIIREINDDGTTVIMVSHDMEAAMKYASHILHICHKPLFFGKKEDYAVTDVCCQFTDGGEEK